MNAVIGYVNGLISAMYMLYNAVAMVINVIPGLDNIATKVAPQIPTMGGTSTPAVSGGGFGREGGTGSIGGVTLPNIANIPIMSPAVTGGSGGGGGGGGGGFTPVVSGGGPYQGPSAIPGFMGGNAERIANRGDITINVTGGLATSAEIGESVVNSLLAYQRVSGPLDLQIAI